MQRGRVGVAGRGRARGRRGRRRLRVLPARAQQLRRPQRNSAPALPALTQKCWRHAARQSRRSIGKQAPTRGALVRVA